MQVQNEPIASLRTRGAQLTPDLSSLRGRQQLTWSTPPTASRFSASGACSGAGLFCSTLSIANATANETGRYRCSYRDLRAEDGKTSAEVYVFVRGTKRRSV